MKFSKSISKPNTLSNSSSLFSLRPSPRPLNKPFPASTNSGSSAMISCASWTMYFAMTLPCSLVSPAAASRSCEKSVKNVAPLPASSLSAGKRTLPNAVLAVCTDASAASSCSEKASHFFWSSVSGSPASLAAFAASAASLAKLAIFARIATAAVPSAATPATEAAEIAPMPFAAPPATFKVPLAVAPATLPIPFNAFPDASTALPSALADALATSMASPKTGML